MARLCSPTRESRWLQEVFMMQSAKHRARCRRYRNLRHANARRIGSHLPTTARDRFRCLNVRPDSNAVLGPAGGVLRTASVRMTHSPRHTTELRVISSCARTYVTRRLARTCPRLSRMNLCVSRGRRLASQPCPINHGPCYEDSPDSKCHSRHRVWRQTVFDRPMVRPEGRNSGL